MSGYYKPFSFRFRSNSESFIFSLRINRQRPTWGTPVSPLLGNIAIFLFYFSLIALAQSSWVFEGVYGDDGAYVARNTLEFSRHPLIPYAGLAGSGMLDSGHPLFYAWFVGVQWAVAGMRHAVFYLNLWVYGALAMMMTHLLAQGMARRAFGARAPRWTGLAAGVSLYSLPYFISHTHQWVAAIPHLAICVSMIWLWMKDYRWGLTIVLCLMTLFRIDGAFFVLGLGMFDLWHGWQVRRIRNLSKLAVLILPYVLSAVCLGLYLFVKLVVLDLPLSTIDANKPQWITSLDASKITVPAILWSNLEFAQKYMTSAISYSMKPWLIPIGLAALLLMGRGVWRRFGEAGEGAEAKRVVCGPGPGYWAIMGAYLAMLAPPLIFFVLNGHLLLFRRFIPFHLLFIILGIHALIYLFQRRRMIALVLIMIWCGVQGVRWHDAWLERMTFGNQALYSALKPYHIDQSQDLHLRKAVLQEAVDWIVKSPDRMRIVGAYYTLGMIQFPANGYVMREVSGYTPYYLVENDLVEWMIDEYRREGLDLYLLRSSFDTQIELGALDTILASQTAFERKGAFTNSIGDVIEVYRYRTEGEMVAGGGVVEPME